MSISTDTSHSRSPKKRKEREFEADGGQETNIHVVVRCRGRNDREVRENSGVVVSTDGVKGKNVELSMGASALSNKTYHFDKVFSPAADQSMIYDDVVTPILDEMLQGYNCTIFAYGQTGTGKTYTMSGDMSDTLGFLSDSAGIIPRVLHSLFGKLEEDEAESSVKCSFIELYNEELRDLLSLDDTTKLKIYDDAQKKGHSATIVQGMEEAHIKTARDGIKLLQDGSHKRQVAATKCNDLSSRSHTVFTVTAYIKRTTETGEDFVSAGKLNLVDLAGSENIQRSGAENKRAAEAGLINKSLLTLGRVINALVERGSHIPYRESKLTRLLQDSLGGRTKTCIIATVSPAKSNLEETISTLDYAFRAKNIKNKPQVNQMVSKKTLLREFTAEIEKLKGELIATRQRNGVYLTTEGYEAMVEESESRRILSEEQHARIETMETNLRNKVQELFSLTSIFNVLKKDNDGTKQILDETKDVLEKTEIVLADTRLNLGEETVIRKAHQVTEEQLNNVGGELISTLEQTVSDVGGLQSKIKRKSELQNLNRQEWQASQNQVVDVTQIVESKLEEFKAEQGEIIAALSGRMQRFVQEELQKLGATQDLLREKVASFEASEKEVNEQTSGAKEDMNEVLEEIKVLREDVKRKVGEGLSGLSAAAGRISAEVINELGSFHTQLHTSYSSLGKDFKNIFEELVKHVSSQKTEADDIRQKASSAARTAMQADADVSIRLETCLNEERAQASLDRQDLLMQITTLINSSGEAQESRWQSKINAVRKDISSARSTFDTANENYNTSMNVWLEKESSLVGEVLKSRDTLKSKMKDDWKAINEHNTSIQATTKSVHEETIRIVDAQMKDMASQMQALDDFVTRARSQNERHHSRHVASLQGLASTVHQSYSSIGDHFVSTYDRVRDIGGDVSTQSTALSASLPPLASTIQQPLEDLRANITAAPLKEYTPTGDTPRKTQYQYPTTLPRTEPYDKLLGKQTFSSPRHTNSAHSPHKSPSKSIVYTDAPSAHSVPPISPSKDPNPASLREISLNVNASLKRNNSDSQAATAATSIKADPEVVGMGPPPLKRQATESKLPQKFGGGRAGVVKLEGRENVGAGRRLRSSPTG
ncbi:MAG: kinesin motor protein cin8 [Alectoria fallacina]|uniref:Kinesin motor protein cin8 n=1 Tax=Alectoria fallacina TaxID=1903189 RepID=A0A8H3EYP8_9LECA|nr:MAG: kinesin motor protein cin8 [Alectoria fallacina]